MKVLYEDCNWRRKNKFRERKKQLGSHNSSIIIVYYLALRNNCKKLAEIYTKPHISCSKLAISSFNEIQSPQNFQYSCNRSYLTLLVIFSHFRQSRIFFTKLGTFAKMLPNFVIVHKSSCGERRSFKLFLHHLFIR